MTKKLSFKEKNRHLHLLKDETMFDKDYVLFKECCPRSKLHNELGRITRFNRSGLYERMLFELLDVADIEKIKQNREGKEADPLPFFENAEAALYYVNTYLGFDNLNEDAPAILLSDKHEAALLSCITEEDARSICIEIENEMAQAQQIQANNSDDSIDESSPEPKDDSINTDGDISAQKSEAANKPQDTGVEKTAEKSDKSKPKHKVTNITPPKKKRSKAKAKR